MNWNSPIVKVVVGGIILLVPLLLLEMYLYHHDKRIMQNRCTTLGIIINIYNAGGHVYYKFVYDAKGKHYVKDSARDDSNFLRRCKKDKQKAAIENVDCLNRVFIVEYVCDDPTTSRILLDQPLPDTLRTLP